MFYLREGFKKSSSDPSQPGRALDKKNSKITQIFIIFIITKFGENFEEKNDICFFLKCFGGKSGSQKV